MWSRTSLLILATILLGSVINAESSDILNACPEKCRCFTTAEGLHKASCFSTSDLRKYSQKHKHHNINILDLSNSNISKFNNDLDKFTEVVTIDLSFNQLTDLKKLLQNSKKLVHLNLENNLLKKFSATVIPNSVSSLNLKNNYIENVPSDLHLLRDLEHLELKGNPIHCSCENIKTFNKLSSNHVVIDDVVCASPLTRKGKMLSSIKPSEICSKVDKKNEFVPLEDMMFGDEAADTEIFGPSMDENKSMEMKEDNNLIGETWEANGKNVEKDNIEEIEYYPVGETSTVSDRDNFDSLTEGSGDDSEQLLPLTNYEAFSNSSIEESGSGESGSGKMNTIFDDEAFDGSGDSEDNLTTTTMATFVTGAFNPFFIPVDHEHNDTLEPFERPTVFQGVINWDEPNDKTTTKREDSSTESPVIAVSVGSVNGENPKRTSAEINLAQPEDSKEPVKTSLGTYICIGIIIVLLVGLISLSIIKGRIRKNRDRRLIRQQKRDVEKGGKELVDMNKSLLGKPLNQAIEEEKERKRNGNYELVPTHETFKKPENGNALPNSEKEKQKLIDQNNQIPTKKEPVENGNRKSDNISPDDHPISVAPIKSEVDGSSSPDDKYPEYESAYPSEYIPVYSPDMGRVKIKLSETPKPKTPVLINRSRSNAGDIIITPAVDQNLPVNNST